MAQFFLAVLILRFVNFLRALLFGDYPAGPLGMGY